MKNISILLAVVLGVLAPWRAQAGGDEVVVIYNSRVPESKALAEYYAKARQVPKKQIYGFALPARELITRDEFRESLQLPLAKKLEGDGLWKFGYVTNRATGNEEPRIEHRVVQSKIRYAVLCYGVPLNIQADINIHEPAAEKMQLELRRNEAAVDSELACLPVVKMGLPIAGPLPNPFYGTTNVALLSPTNGILLVARLDGPTPEIARGLVDKALQAETNGLWGRVYVDARNITDPNYKLGDDWMHGAAALMHQLGFETVLDEKPDTFPADFPMSQIAIYCGWYTADADGPFAQPKVEFMPGAFAYHLHSYSAATLHSTNQNWCGPLLAKGATVTMGCVNEPYLAATPNIAIFLARFVAESFTFGEAAWAAQPTLSWQTTVVGDPLYRPFNTSPQILHNRLAQTKNPLLEWSYLRMINLQRIQGTPAAQVAKNLGSLELTSHSAVLTEKLADLYEAEGKPSSAIATYQRALTLNPSPEQGIRLRLTLAEKLLAQGRADDAAANYKQLLTEAPNYPGRNLIAEKLAALEPKPAVTNAPPKS